MTSFFQYKLNGTAPSSSSTDVVHGSNSQPNSPVRNRRKLNQQKDQPQQVDLEDGSPSKTKDVAIPVIQISAAKDNEENSIDSTININTTNINSDKLNMDASRGMESSSSAVPLLNKTMKPSTASSTTGSGVGGGSVKSTTACFNYCLCSVSMVLVNKSLASSYNHLIQGDGLNILLVVFQALTAVICVEFCRRTGMIEDYPPLTYETAKSWAPVNLFFCGMLFTGMASLQTNSVPIVTVFKNISNIFTTAGDYFWFNSQPEQLVLASFGVMLSGAVAAAWNDLTVTPMGLFWLAMNCVTSAGYVLYMKYAMQSIQLTKFGMVYVNNVLCIVFLLPVAYAFGEVQLFCNTHELHTFDYAIKNIFAGFVGFFLNFASLTCVQATSPTTYVIVGSLNKVPITFLGYFMFDSKISADTWFYICVSLCGGFLYSYAKILSSRGHKHSN